MSRIVCSFAGHSNVNDGDVKEKILPALGHEYQVVELPTE